MHEKCTANRTSGLGIYNVSLWTIGNLAINVPLLPKPQHEGGAAGWSVQTRDVMVSVSRCPGASQELARRASSIPHYLYSYPHNPRPEERHRRTQEESRAWTRRAGSLSCELSPCCANIIVIPAYTYCFDDEKMLKVKWEAKEYRYRFSQGGDWRERIRNIIITKPRRHCKLIFAQKCFTNAF